MLMRRIVKKGWVKVVNARPHTVRYLITPAGMAAKARMTRAYLSSTLRFYSETRERIGESLEALSMEWSVPEAEAAARNGEKEIVFYGAGEVAEIAYVSLQASDLKLIGVVDDHRTQPFFGFPVQRLDRLCSMQLDGEPFGRLVVMSFTERHKIRANLAARSVPSDRVVWL